LAVPIFILTLPIVALFMLLDSTSSKLVGKLIRPFVFCLIAAVVVLCWTARNYYVFNKFIPIATNSGFNLFVGNSENAGFNTGTAIDWKEHELHIQQQNLNEYDKDLYFRDQATEWVKTNPSSAIKLYFGKVLNYFNYTNKLFVEEQGSKVKDIVMFLSYMPLLLIALLRLFCVSKCPLSRTEKYLYLVYFGMAFMSAIFFTRLRFRVPFDFCLIAIVSIVCSRFLKRSRLEQLCIKNWGTPLAVPAFSLRPSCSTKLFSSRDTKN
jgi:4-amino-4-deoxy-L-arabinose transferase-like glycosyltransferase